jgi:hypothetical protein
LWGAGVSSCVKDFTQPLDPRCMASFSLGKVFCPLGDAELRM